MHICLALVTRNMFVWAEFIWYISTSQSVQTSVISLTMCSSLAISCRLMSLLMTEVCMALTLLLNTEQVLAIDYAVWPCISSYDFHLDFMKQKNLSVLPSLLANALVLIFSFQVLFLVQLKLNWLWNNTVLTGFLFVIATHLCHVCWFSFLDEFMEL